MLVTVKPIEKDKWHGKKGKESFTKPKSIQAMPDINTMRYKTGLTEEDKKFLAKSEIGYDLSDNYVKDKVHPFWDMPVGHLVLPNATKIFDTKKPMDRIYVGIMKGSDLVANSQSELEEGLWPDSTHVIFSEEEENEIKASKIQIRKRAVVESMSLSDAKKAQIVMIISGEQIKGKDSNTIEVTFDKVLQKDPQAVLNYMQMNSEEMSLQAVVIEAMQKAVLRKRGLNIMYHDTVIGSSIPSVVDFLMEDENQDLKFRIVEAIA